MTLLITEELSEGDKSNHYLEAVRVLSCYSEIRREAVIWGNVAGHDELQRSQVGLESSTCGTAYDSLLFLLQEFTLASRLNPTS
jgi:hypothetical protein